MNTERLLKLADFLDQLPEEKLYMDRWSHDCGAAGCALGWACTIPEFIEAGLRFNEEKCPVYNNSYGYGAAEEFFGIPDALVIFSPYAYGPYWGTKVAPKEVASKIRRLVDDNS